MDLAGAWVRADVENGIELESALRQYIVDYRLNLTLSPWASGRLSLPSWKRKPLLACRDRYSHPRTVSQSPAPTKELVEHLVEQFGILRLTAVQLGPLLPQARVQGEILAMVLSRASAPAPSMAHPKLGPRPAPRLILLLVTT